MGVLRGVTSLQLPQTSAKKKPAALNGPTNTSDFTARSIGRKLISKCESRCAFTFLNFASVVVCVLFDIYGEDNPFDAYISFFIVDLPTGKSRKISDAAYLLAVSIFFAVCSGTSMSWIKTY